jgi:DNA-directed RNA polymerase specialized sigma24 family protein
MHPALKPTSFLPQPPAAEALARGLVDATDLLQLKAIARYHARGLPPEIGWSDLLQEAFARVLDGSRRQPSGVPFVAFLAGVMRSIRSEYWRRAGREARRRLAVGDRSETPDPAGDPERQAIAAQQLAEIEQLFADDGNARQMLAGLAEGRSPSEIRARTGLSKAEYESTRKRIRRALLREGLRTKLP